MFHIFKYRFITFIKMKSLIFWTLAFPIVLSTLFYFAFGNFDEIGKFEVINVAIIHGENEGFEELIDSLSEVGEDQILSSKYVSENEANELLSQGEVDAVLVADEIPSIMFYKETMQIQILKEIVLSYLSLNATVGNIAESGDLDINDVISNKVEIKSVESNAVETSPASQYFFTVVAMCIIYGSFFGANSISTIQANQSSKAIRLNVTPTHKLKVVLVDFIVTYMIMFIEVAIIVFYITSILGIDFGSNTGYMWIINLSGMLMSLGFGILVGCISKFSSITNINILSASGLFSCFLAGMMINTLPYEIDRVFPIVKYLNPASLIVNSYNMLYYYDDISDIYINAAILISMGVIFLFASYNVLRGKTYASI